MLTALARRARGSERQVWAALFAGALTWAVHAGVDWDWEMPAVTAWVFAIGGAAVAPRAGRNRADAEIHRSRVPVAAGLVVAAATPALLVFSQSSLDASSNAFRHSNCGRARSEAFSSIDALAVRPEPYRIVGYCDLSEGRPADAVEAMQKALDNSPRNWESHYGLALALASAGRDPRAEIDQAVAMNPREELVTSAAKAFGKEATPDGWRRAAPDLMQAGLDSGRLTLN
jgi:hypothetical protein